MWEGIDSRFNNFVVYLKCKYNIVSRLLNLDRGERALDMLGRKEVGGNEDGRKNYTTDISSCSLLIIKILHMTSVKLCLCLQCQ